MLGVVLDVLWLWPFVVLALAPRLAAKRAPDIRFRRRPPTGVQIDRLRRRLLVRAMLLPVVHLTLEGFDALSPATVAMQRLCAVAAATLLLALALLDGGG